MKKNESWWRRSGIGESGSTLGAGSAAVGHDAVTADIQVRSLGDELAGWDASRLAALLLRRPDIAGPDAPRDVGELAERAQDLASLRDAIAGCTLAESRLLQVIVCCARDCTQDELAAALPDGSALCDVEKVLLSLEQCAFIWRYGGRIYSSSALRTAVPTRFGLPVRVLLEAQTVEYAKHVLRILQAETHARGVTLRASTREVTGRPLRKAEVIDDIESILTTPGAVPALLEGASADDRELAIELSSSTHGLRSAHLYFSPYSRPGYYSQSRGYWLFERAMLLPGMDGAAYEPREVGVALCGKAVDDLAVDEPELAVGEVDGSSVEIAAGSRAASLLDSVDDLLEAWEEEPVAELKSGGLGVTAIKKAATLLEMSVRDATRLVEFLYLAGLIESSIVVRKEGRHAVYDRLIAPSSAAAGWLNREPVVRWRELAGAWLRADRWPSMPARELHGDDAAKRIPVTGSQFAKDASALRRDVLASLASLDGRPSIDGDDERSGRGTQWLVPSTTLKALAEHLYWERPQRWLNKNGIEPFELVEWTYEEAEMLGIVAQGRLSSMGAALLGGDNSRAQQALAACWPEETVKFTVQADLTAVVIGRLSRSVLIELRLLADRESQGAASIFRFSEASLHRAIASGRDPDTIMDFLKRHSSKGVPQSLSYLVGDVARRHGHIEVGSAASFVISKDPAVLADACVHRRTRKLGLCQLAPTVAVSALGPDKVVSVLREAGFLPVSAETSGTPSDSPVPKEIDSIRRSLGGVVALQSATASGASKGLPEPFRSQPSAQRSARVNLRAWAVQSGYHLGEQPVKLSQRSARELAEQLLAGPAGRRGGKRTASGSSSGRLPSRQRSR